MNANQRTSPHGRRVAASRRECLPIAMLQTLGVAAMLVAFVLRTQSALSDPMEPNAGPSGPPELSCHSYDADAFLPDDTVASLWVPKGGVRARGRLPIPCTESVSGSAAKPAPDSGAAGALKATLFGPNRTPLERFQSGFDMYSWLTFIALNVPEDNGAKFGEPDAATVWEKEFVPLNEVVQFNDESKNFTLRSPPQLCGKLVKPGPDAPQLLVTVDEVAFDQPFKTGPLIDQQGNYSLNTIFMNRTMADFITRNGLQTYAGQHGTGAEAGFEGPIAFPVGTPDPPVLGAVMIKASWRVLTKNDDSTEFHTIRALRYFPPSGHFAGSCDLVTLGLVGFHVVHKTKDRHQWVWTTFEHVRNVPTLSEARRGIYSQRSYFFYDVTHRPSDCQLGMGPLCDQSETVNSPPDRRWDPLHPSSEKSQIVRVQDITPDAQAINKAARVYLDSLKSQTGFSSRMVWDHYQLISTQWPANFECAAELQNSTNEQADPACSPAPEFLPNSTLETYIQHDIGAMGGVPQGTSSCIGCHNNAVSYQRAPTAGRAVECGKARPGVACSTASDFTFILEQVCAPMPALKGAKTDNRACLRDH